jgi:hypothetical protein
LNIRPTNLGEYLAIKDPSHLKLACNFLVENTEQLNYVNIRAEFRTAALSPDARQRFTPYWRTIGPFSHLIQKLWLNGIKKHAETTLEKVLLPI